ncbi:hypothetical protein ACH5RR_026479 [Cinchona calisaya]|uniref:Uncharacterized protein n=1 Tax=Cinchona calisaya TaxID=153742 RepID=A0ABD2Z2P6_9GENT
MHQEKRDEVVSFVEFLLENSSMTMNVQMSLIHEELVFLVKFWINLPDPNDCTRELLRISVDICEVAREVATHKYKFHVHEITQDQIREINRLLSCLLDKIKRINAEIFEIDISNFKDNFGVPIKDRVMLKALRKELKFLRSLIFIDHHPRRERKEDFKLFIKYVKSVADEVIFQSFSLHKVDITADMFRNVNLLFSHCLKESSSLRLRYV